MSNYLPTRGAWPILLTPFTTNYALDLGCVQELLTFYEGIGTPGIFALGQASEVLTLSNLERFALARCVGQHAPSRMQTVAVGNFGETLSEQAHALRVIYDSGIQVPLVALSLLPTRDNLGQQLLELADTVASDVPLGIYELPEPEHRLLRVEEVAQVARSGRYHFMKDTCRQAEIFGQKAAAAAGTPLKLFQANLKVLPASLEVGAHGFCGWMPIVAPELSAQVCDTANTSPAMRLQAYEKLLALQTLMVANGFPASAKYLLRRRGLHLGTQCRVKLSVDFTPASAQAMDEFLSQEDWYGIIPV